MKRLKTENLAQNVEGLTLCFVSSFPPNSANLSEYAYFLVSELQRLPGIRQIYVIANNASNTRKVTSKDKLSVNNVWNADDVFSILSIFSFIIRLRPDIVHFNVHMAVFGKSRLANFFGLSLPFICGFIGFKTIVTLHNIYEKVDVEKMGFRNSLQNRMGSYLVLKLMTSRSTLTLLVRSYVEFLMNKYSSRRIFWIPHGTWDVITKDYPISRNPKTILYMGHSGPSKDIKLLLKAYHLVKKSERQVRLVVAGSSHPNYPNFLEEYANINEPEIKFVGYINNNDLPSFLGKAHVLVLPYHTCTGTSGMAHLAASYGVPIVATDLPEFRELQEEGCGILLCSHDPKSMMEKINLILDDPKTSEELRRRSLEFASNRNWSKIAEKFYRLYESKVLNRFSPK